jgi:hypothetical protein
MRKHMPELQISRRYKFRQLLPKIDALLRSPEVARDLDPRDDEHGQQVTKAFGSEGEGNA